MQSLSNFGMRFGFGLAVLTLKCRKHELQHFTFDTG